MGTHSLSGRGTPGVWSEEVEFAGNLSGEKAVKRATFFRVSADSTRDGNTKAGAPIPSVEAESSLARALAEMFMEMGKPKPPELPGLLLKPGAFPSSANNVV